MMQVDGKDYPVSAEAPIGYDFRPGKRPRELPESERPTCGMSVRAGIVVTGTEVLSDEPRTATARGCPSSCASSASR